MISSSSRTLVRHLSRPALYRRNAHSKFVGREGNDDVRLEKSKEEQLACSKTESSAEDGDDSDVGQKDVDIADI